MGPLLTVGFVGFFKNIFSSDSKVVCVWQEFLSFHLDVVFVSKTVKTSSLVKGQTAGSLPFPLLQLGLQRGSAEHNRDRKAHSRASVLSLRGFTFNTCLSFLSNSSKKIPSHLFKANHPLTMMHLPEPLPLPGTLWVTRRVVWFAIQRPTARSRKSLALGDSQLFPGGTKRARLSAPKCTHTVVSPMLPWEGTPASWHSEHALLGHQV